MLEPLGQYAQREYLRSPHCLFARLTIRQDTGKCGHFRYPAAIDLLFDLDCVHARIIPRGGPLRHTGGR